MTFRRFVVFCGLDNEYKAKVKTQYPKTLEEAIKSAQFFNDMSDKKSLSLSINKSSLSNFSPFKNKRKNANFSIEEHPKKPKGAKGSLTSDELASACKENLCFNCLGQHARKDCPQLCSHDLLRTRSRRKQCIWCNFFLWRLVLNTRLCKLATKPQCMNVVSQRLYGTNFWSSHELFCL